MPYVRGESLRQRLSREKQLPTDEAVAILRQVAAALDHAHARGLVHRDIKPENILLHEGEAMVTDFGIALAAEAAPGDRLTGTGLMVGTPEYMSPEQAAGERTLDARSDVYSLGCVLYEMLAGEPPYTGAHGPGGDRQAIHRPGAPRARACARWCRLPWSRRSCARSPGSPPTASHPPGHLPKRSPARPRDTARASIGRRAPVPAT